MSDVGTNFISEKFMISEGTRHPSCSAITVQSPHQWESRGMPQVCKVNNGENALE